jgi:hypothetical protein
MSRAGTLTVHKVVLAVCNNHHRLSHLVFSVWISLVRFMWSDGLATLDCF